MSKILSEILIQSKVCQLITFNWSLSSGSVGYDIPFKELLSDKYIIVSIGRITAERKTKLIVVYLGIICVSTTSMSILESCLPLWLMENMRPTPEKWQLGIDQIQLSCSLILIVNEWRIRHCLHPRQHWILDRN